MKITIIEALRLKKELSTVVNRTVNFVRSEAAVGKMYEDTTLLSEQNPVTINDALPVLEQLISMNVELNEKIDAFNYSNKIPTLVRARKNASLILDIMTDINKKSQPKTSTTNKVIHDKVVSVLSEFKPLLSRTELRSSLKKEKSLVRNIQAEIDKINTQTIEVGFNYDMLAELTELSDSSNRYM